MITSPLLYLFIVAFVATLFSLKASLVSLLFTFILSVILANIGLFAQIQDIKQLFLLTLHNLTPAMLFLTFLAFNLKEFLRSKTIGCACTIGTKRYWFLIALSLGVSLLTQVISLVFFPLYSFIASTILAILLGIAGSKTSLFYLNGIRDIAKTMSYVIVALLGSQTIF